MKLSDPPQDVRPMLELFSRMDVDERSYFTDLALCLAGNADQNLQLSVFQRGQAMGLDMQPIKDQLMVNI